MSKKRSSGKKKSSRKKNNGRNPSLGKAAGSKAAVVAAPNSESDRQADLNESTAVEMNNSKDEKKQPVKADRNEAKQPVKISRGETKQPVKVRERIAGYDLIRCFSALMIIAFHFSGQTRTYENMEEFPHFFTFSLSEWGYVAVIMFFMLTGSTLFGRYNRFDSFKSLGSFYKSRFLRLFPMFWMIWIYLYTLDVLQVHKFFYRENKWSIILSVFGMDGYMSIHGLKTYYQIGEWFLGALVLIYILYPIIAKLFQQGIFFKILIPVGFAAAYVYFSFYGPGRILSQRNIASCLTYVVLGMLFEKFRKRLTGIIPMIISLAGVLVLFFVKMPEGMPEMIYAISFAVMLYIFLFSLADFIKKIKPFWWLICFVSAQSYGIFLLQHKVIDYVNYSFREVQLSTQDEWLVLLLITVLTILFATVADCVIQGAKYKLSRGKTK